MTVALFHSAVSQMGISRGVQKSSRSAKSACYGNLVSLSSKFQILAENLIHFLNPEHTRSNFLFRLVLSKRRAHPISGSNGILSMPTKLPHYTPGLFLFLLLLLIITTISAITTIIRIFPSCSTMKPHRTFRKIRIPHPAKSNPPGKKNLLIDRLGLRLFWCRRKLRSPGHLQYLHCRHMFFREVAQVHGDHPCCTTCGCFPKLDLDRTTRQLTGYLSGQN